jgi:hypothetical protein
MSNRIWKNFRFLRQLLEASREDSSGKLNDGSVLLEKSSQKRFPERRNSENGTFVARKGSLVHFPVCSFFQCIPASSVSQFPVVLQDCLNEVKKESRTNSSEASFQFHRNSTVFQFYS